MCSKSGVVLMAFHHSGDHFRRVLLEDHLVTPTPRQGRRQSASTAASAARRWSINFYRCLKLSVKGSEQDTEERHEDNDRRHFVLRCLLAACPVHICCLHMRRAYTLLYDLAVRFCSDRLRQPMYPSVHLCDRHVPVSEKQVY